MPVTWSMPTIEMSRFAILFENEKEKSKVENMVILMGSLQNSISLNADIFFRWMICDRKF